MAKEILATKITDLPRTAKAVLIELVSYAKVRNLAEPVFPAISTLSRKMNVSEYTVQRHIKTLIEQGYIERKSQSHRKHGGFAVIQTVLKRRVAELVGLPYNPNSFGQRSLWPVMVDPNDSNLEAHLPEESMPEVSPFAAHPRKPVPHSKFVAVQKDGAHASIPEDLVFLLDKGAHVYQVCNWMARARKTMYQLSDLVRMRKERIQNAGNSVGYLVGLLKAAERGEKITDYSGSLNTATDEIRAAKTRKHQEEEAAAMRKLGGKLVEWDSPSGPRWIRIEKNANTGSVYCVNPRDNPLVNTNVRIAVLTVDRYIQSGAAKVIFDYAASYTRDNIQLLALMQKSVKKILRSKI
ncbi:MAG: helix-turn-helix domain-containing protein [Acidithiobacillus sp.]|nr:helix-turn-helix domain-containing protein [Acidithiobacillus sp.]